MRAALRPVRDRCVYQPVLSKTNRHVTSCHVTLHNIASLPDWLVLESKGEPGDGTGTASITNNRDFALRFVAYSLPINIPSYLLWGAMHAVATNYRFVLSRLLWYGIFYRNAAFYSNGNTTPWHGMVWHGIKFRCNLVSQRWPTILEIIYPGIDPQLERRNDKTISPATYIKNAITMCCSVCWRHAEMQ